MNARRLLLAVSLLSSALLSACTGSEDACAVPGTAAACTCGSAPGARVCSSERSWGDCDCSGTIALPVAVMPGTPTAGTGASGTGMSSAGTSGGKHDAGMPKPDSGLPTDGGADDGALADGSVTPPGAAYRGCMTNMDCDPGATCVITAGVPMMSVCAPACVNTVDCPVPDGKYDAKLNCVTATCKLDCTPVLFAPLLSCPTGMTCVVAALGNAFCHDDGM